MFQQIRLPLGGGWIDFRHLSSSKKTSKNVFIWSFTSRPVLRPKAVLEGQNTNAPTLKGRRTPAARRRSSSWNCASRLAGAGAEGAAPASGGGGGPAAGWGSLPCPRAGVAGEAMTSQEP